MSQPTPPEPRPDQASSSPHTVWDDEDEAREEYVETADESDQEPEHGDTTG